MSKYIVNWVEIKTAKTGKVYKNTTLQTEGGSLVDKVSIWPDFLGYENVQTGREIEGEIRTNEKGYRSLVGSSQQLQYGKNPVRVNPLVKATSESVAKSQDRKEDSIKVSSTARDATLLTVEWLKQRNLNPGAIDFPPTDDEVKKKWLELRQWLLDHFDVDPRDKEKAF